MRVVLISNNPLFTSLCENSVQWILREGSPLQVLQAARDLVHKGYRILNHPLYGNYRPYQQPFRTLMLMEPSSSAASSKDNAVHLPPKVDLESLHLIEEAMLVYSQARVIEPAEAPKKMYDDCSELDFALMQATVGEYGSYLTGPAVMGENQKHVATA